MKAIVKEIGSQALSDKEPLVILFGDTATPALKKYSVIQTISEETPVELKVSGKILFDGEEYTIQYVGNTANQNLQAIGHLTLIFDAVPEEDRIVNGVYLTPYVVPNFNKNTEIVYL
ncbi:PTS sorbitol transporter subunit IIA [Enterococcus sp. JM4C]|uniref:PTS glucitol/sorbitol transporter subunit IIA n=1 Tax=Candidatus Enterococcus huntleyi TaxID=1857217 RepID=UPI00137A11E3|nr:PTS glucitol/sorbitol transporter subunit IIA [Enterococcus sp. JM4C]KAF1295533.1 PTS sorbitol transporter subunit IIA [Enterococcus sp. JM4C]